MKLTAFPRGDTQFAYLKSYSPYHGAPQTSSPGLYTFRFYGRQARTGADRCSVTITFYNRVLQTKTVKVLFDVSAA